MNELVRTVTLTDMVAYAGATWDWHRLHYDPGYVAERGLAAPVVDGQLLGAFMVEQVQDHFGPDAVVTGCEFRFTAMVFAGETVRVVAVGQHPARTAATGEAGGGDRAGELVVDQQVVVGDRLCAKGTTTVRVPAGAEGAGG